MHVEERRTKYKGSNVMMTITTEMMATMLVMMMMMVMMGLKPHGSQQ